MDSDLYPPGFKFHPTGEELVIHYLRPKLNRQALKFDIIREVDLYKCEPWDLPEKSLIGGSDTEWYFFGVLDKKYPRGARSNRSTKCGFWKTTGKDKPVKSDSNKIGMKRTLVFHEGRAPRGKRTDWVMYEYRLEDDNSKKLTWDAVVLCHVFKKNKSSCIDTEEQIHSFTNQDNDINVPVTKKFAVVSGDELLDALESATTLTVLDDFVEIAITDDQILEQGVQDRSIVSQDANMGSIITDVETQPKTYCDPGISIQLDIADRPFPGDTYMLMGEQEGTDDLFGAENDAKVIEQLYDSLVEAIEDDTSEEQIIEDLLQHTQTPGEATGFEDTTHVSLIESTDELFAEDSWRSGGNSFSSFEAGDTVNPQEYLLWLLESGDAYLPLSQPLQSAGEDSTQDETVTTQLHPENLQHEPLSLDSLLMDAASSAQRTFAANRFTSQRTFVANGSTSQPIIPSEANRPPSIVAKVLDAISVLPALAAEIPPDFDRSMPPLITAPSRIHRAPSLSSVSENSIAHSSLIMSVGKVRHSSTAAEGDDRKRARHSNNVDYSTSSYTNSRRNHRIIHGTSAMGSFSFLLLLVAVTAIFWFLLLLLSGVFALLEI